MRRRSNDDEAAEQARREQEARDEEVLREYGEMLECAADDEGIPRNPEGALIPPPQTATADPTGVKVEDED